MRLTILAVGRLKAGPERDLYDRYSERIAAAGKGVSLTIDLREFPESRASSAVVRVAEETTALTGAAPAGARLIVLDSTGKSMTSAAFAERLGRWRDDGTKDVAMVVGGPDGLDRSILAKANLTLAFGAVTWPHQLVRIMLVEQAYRAVTILARHPYHRS